MSFAVFADGSANLPQEMLEGIQLLPCEYTVDGVPHTYWGDVNRFDGHRFYEDLKTGRIVRTSLLNTQLFLSRFGTVLAQGTDIIYVSSSSGISGTYNAARLAAQELMELYKGRFVHIVDSLGCGFGKDCSPAEIEILPDGRGAPQVRLSGAAAKTSAAAGILSWAISISHEKDYAAAMAVAEISAACGK